MITIYDASGQFIKYDSLTFSGGEEHIRLKNNAFGRDQIQGSRVKIVAHLWAGREILQLLMITDALRRAGATDIDLVMPYVPYARQDRVCNPGEALSIKVFCDLVNSQKYRTVEIWDPHSDVTPALLERCRVYEQKEFAKLIPGINQMTLIAPDGGALKKTYALQSIVQRPVGIGTKHRDTKTGEITGTSISTPEFSWGGEFLIVDDICDGGKTFIELSKVLKSPYYGHNSKVYLYVTHGIFSKGLNVLKPYIDHVYTANIFPDRYQGNEGYVTILRRN